MALTDDQLEDVWAALDEGKRIVTYLDEAGISGERPRDVMAQLIGKYGRDEVMTKFQEKIGASQRPSVDVFMERLDGRFGRLISDATPEQLDKAEAHLQSMLVALNIARST